MQHTHHTQADMLCPLPVRLAVWGVLLVIALGSIWLIDRRAMMNMTPVETLPAETQSPTK